MSRNFDLRSIYLYLVCLVTLIIFIFGTIFTFQRAVDILVGGNYYYMSLQDFEQRFYVYGPDGKREAPQISREEINQRYEEYLAQEKRRSTANNIRNLASSFSAMVVGGGFWIYHWRKIKDNTI